ncbi:MAG: metallophosphoesterase [Gammaproteobacteria bacterium]|nr:MAG: metallophosphoesterase [Gammaproteobacteria bacterium]RLA53958.1 MAG: metallophosphoesterase [Gammaproteobacteria bacterium]
MTSAPGFAFVHLSDPHLTSLDTVGWRQLISKRLLGYLSWRLKRRAIHRVEVLDALARDLKNQHFDHLVVTGDLTHIALPEEFSEARLWLDSLGDPENVSIVPGNHDAYVRIPERQGLGKWAPYIASDADVPVEAGDNCFNFPTLRIRQGVAFIGLSSAVPTLPFLATGRVGRAQRKRFAHLLQWAGQRGLCRVVLIHHPPVPGVEIWRKRLVDADEIGDIIDAQGAELILHGHCHQDVENRLTFAGKNQVPVIGVPSALSMHSDPERVARYYLYNVNVTPTTWQLDVSVHAYNIESDSFRPCRQTTIEVPRTTAAAG